ncbi:MAG TPA: hypothetical protein VFK62_05695 [Gaiellaceae bacterium]|nr:hypothetical protein [Gaiellaceae bacterium]
MARLTQARAWAALLLAAVCGFALGACGGGGGGAIGSLSVTLTRTTQTQTVTTTTPGATVTQPFSPPPPPPPPPAQTTASASSTSSTPWGWIILGVALALALLLGLILWRRHRAGAADWGRQTAEFNRRVLVALDDVLAKGSVVTGQVEALASEARGFEAHAPDDASRAAATSVRARLDELASALETDRTLRLSTPAPSQEQVTYSTALIRQQAEELRATLRPPDPGRASAWPTR